MTITTPQDLVSFALRAAGVVGVGQTASGEDFGDVFSALNAMLGSWNTKRWLVWHLVDTAVTSTGAQSYTVGPGGDYNIARPARIEAAFVRQTYPAQPNLADWPMMILESREDYNRVRQKSVNGMPSALFYDADYPIGAVYPVPVPTASLYSVHITTRQVLSQFTSSIQSLNLPDEYTEALWSNLAIRVGAIYPGLKISDDTRRIAKASLAAIAGANTQIPTLTMPVALQRRSRFNIYSGG